MEQCGCQCWTDPISTGARGAKDLARCITNRSNPWHNDKPNVNFQRDLNLMIEGDREYLDDPTLSERLPHESSRMRGVTSSGSAPSHGKQPKGQK
jgi:hypothetical protein